MNDHLHDEALDRRVDQGLRETTGAETPPDVVAAVLARHATGEVDDRLDDAELDRAIEGDEDAVRSAAARSATRRRWLAAALVLLGVGTVLGAWFLSRPTTRGPEPPFAGPPQEPRSADYATVGTLAEIEALPATTRFVEGTNLGDTELTALARLRGLEGLRLLARTFSDPTRPPLRLLTDAALPTLGAFANLRELVIDAQESLTGAGLGVLTAMPNLRTLGLVRFDTADADLAFLIRLPSLQRLDLTLNHGFRGEGLAAIAACPDLRALSLLGCSQLSPAMLLPLTRLPRLEELDLSGIGRSWRGFFATERDLDKARRLNDERLARATADRAGLDDAGLTELLAMTRLRVLRVADTGLDGSTFAAVRCDRLEVLDLSRSGVLPSIGERLRHQCPNLRDVELAHTAVDDTTVAELAALRRLRRLDLSACEKVTATSLTFFDLMRHLRELRLDDSPWLTLPLAERLLAGGHGLVARRSGDAAFSAGVEVLAARYTEAAAARRYEQVRSLAEIADLPADVAFVDCRGLGDRAVELLARRPGLRGLQLVRDDAEPLTDAAFAHLAQLVGLEELELNNLPRLRGNGSDALAALQQLRRLRIASVDLDDGALAFVQRLPALRDLEIAAAPRIGAATMTAVDGCRALVSLRLESCPALARGAIAGLGAVGSLRDLALLDVGLDDDAIAGLGGLTALERLALKGTFATPALTALSGMTRLQRLSLAGCPRLTTPALELLPVTVVDLDLGRCGGMGPDAGRLLRDRFPGLTRLVAVENDWVDDASLAAILDLPRLRELILTGCRQPTAASFARLRAAISLRVVDVSACPWAVRPLVDELRQARPDLDVRGKVW